MPSLLSNFFFQNQSFDQMCIRDRDSGLVAYVWWYELNGEYLRLQLKQSADDGVIELTIEPYGSAE